MVEPTKCLGCQTMTVELHNLARLDFSLPKINLQNRDRPFWRCAVTNKFLRHENQHDKSLQDTDQLNWSGFVCHNYHHTTKNNDKQQQQQQWLRPLRPTDCVHSKHQTANNQQRTANSNRCEFQTWMQTICLLFVVCYLLFVLLFPVSCLLFLFAVCCLVHCLRPGLKFTPVCCLMDV